MTVLFSNFLIENKEIEKVIADASKRSLSVPRSEMPQLTNDNRDKIMQFFKDNGIKTKSERVDPDSLKFAQANFHKEKVQKLIKDFAPVKDRTIYVTKDSYVLDGNHRVLALSLKKLKANVLRIDMNFKDLVKILKPLDFIEFREEVA